MTRSLKMKRWTGTALILAGINYALTGLPDPLRPLTSGNGLSGIIWLVYPIAVILALVGFAGLHFAQAEKAGKLSWWGLSFIAIGALMSVVMAVLNHFIALPVAYYVNLAAAVSLALGYILIGLAVKRAGVYNGNQGLLLAAAPLVMIVIGNLWVNLLGFGMIALGYSLFMDKRIARPLTDPTGSNEVPKSEHIDPANQG